MTRMVVVVLPANVDDPATPSGGNVYDRRVCAELVAAGWPVREVALPGAWPRPDAPARAALGDTLAGLPDATVVLLDGLVACGVPEVVTPHADRLRLAVLVHLPLADETGLDPADAADLDRAERAVLGAAAAVIATSDWTARQLADRHGLPAHRVRVAVPGVARAELTAADPAGRRLLCVASVTPRKGHDVLVDALATVADLDWSCQCVGALDAAGHVGRVRGRIAHHGLDDRVTLTGPRHGAALIGSYADADLLILASYAETYGMVVTEALARGIPVLASEVGGVPQALGRGDDGVLPGLLVPPGDPATLGAAVRRWLTDADWRQRLRAAAVQRRATLPDWARTAAGIGAVLHDLRRR
ncbi:glycosyltransferase family 4 protein [Solwaraspora sp. WMMA2056]|uniref:glycosyltransferase family 4 protein n=1 Tax=Solwaraspora sp. WMMA2056 TaxID=3015161 RepID=UPI00259BBBA0|nr:glycosyltransferase family 4 protein [Solwaraspora sp. WMMA2056]WJK44093.1 glycosyltransferase family 4 protein [Solwaraspora sp. WMMA2056]